MSAAKDISVTSVDGKILINSAKEIVLSSGGAYIKIGGGHVEIGCPSDLRIKAITIQKQGSASLSPPLPAMPRPYPAKTDIEFRRIYLDGSPIAGSKFIATFPDGSSRKGVLDASGYARISDGPVGASATIRYLDDPNPHSSDVTTDHDPDVDEVMALAQEASNE